MRPVSFLRVGGVWLSTPFAVLDRRQRGTTFLEHQVRSVLNPPESTGIGCWSLNPYVGCEFGCSYCYARFAHRYLAERARDQGQVDPGRFAAMRGANGWEGFEQQIIVKQRRSLLAALHQDLARLAARSETRGGHEERCGEAVLIGTATDPYQPAERRFGITRAVLERLLQAPPVALGVITKSPLVCRDLELLTSLACRHRVTVNISLVTMEPRLIRLFEPRSPLPHARLRALRKLSDAGINTGLLVAPVLPGITDGSRALRRLLEAARNHGARFAHRSPLRLYPAVRPLFLPIVERQFPALAKRYRAVYQGRGDAPAGYAAALRQRFEAIARDVGISTRNELEHPPLTRGPNQLTLFAERPL